tara:strand:- start:1517 stop:2626 length:1110 start_codon:yes stop_codon:yes gene_type:complete
MYMFLSSARAALLLSLARMLPRSTADSQVSYASSRIVRRDLARFDASCGQEPTATVLASLRAQYESLDRVLVVDASLSRRGVNGVGNLFGDYVLWFAAAIATRRAVFIYWSTPKLDRFDLSVFFTGATGELDWAWTPRTEARVGRRWRPGPHQWLQLDSKAPCAELWRPLAGPAPYVRVTLSGGHAIAMSPMCKALPNSTADLAFSSSHLEARTAARASGGVAASAAGVRRAAASAAALLEEHAESLSFGELVGRSAGLQVTRLLLRKGLVAGASSFEPRRPMKNLLRGRLTVPSRWCRSSLAWPTGPNASGAWLRCALGTSCSAAQGHHGGLRCGYEAQARPKPPSPRRPTHRSREPLPDTLPGYLPS